MAQNKIRYPIGIQTFEEVRKLGCVYVDKTQYVYNMTHSDMKYVFLSRPRRFGKSLLVSTLKSYFEGRGDLFKGLAVEKLETEWKKYPVIHLNMSDGKGRDEAGLKAFLIGQLEDCEEDNDMTADDSAEPADRFSKLIKRLYRKTGSQVVVLIDEYDAPMLEVAHEEKNFAKVRNAMKYFYGPLKSCEPYIRFAFMTGITKFSQLSIFSALNNIKNISMLEEYAAICGITEEEMLSQMTDGLDKLAAKKDITRDEAVQRVKAMYDGYHFTWPSPDIYNPYSLVNAFSDGNLNSYWFESGTPTFLVNMLSKFDVLPTEIVNVKADPASFESPADQLDDWVPLLYQSGYLTISGYDAESGMYTLGVPNGEVRTGLFRSLAPGYVGKNSRVTNVIIGELAAALRGGRVDDAMGQLQKAFSSLPYGTGTNTEANYQQIMAALLLACGFVARLEERTAQGRIDIAFDTKDYIYIFELKLDGSAEEALRQIDDRGYAERFATDPRKVVRIGVNFSSATRSIDGWKIG